MTDERSRTAVEVAERFADADVPHDLLETSFGEAQQVPALSLIDGPLDEFVADHPGIDPMEIARACAAEAASSTAFTEHPSAVIAMSTVAFDVANVAYALSGFENHARDQERKNLADLAREVFPSPFEPVSVDPAWLTQPVRLLAQSSYDNRSFEQMPALAVLLEGAGCNDERLLSHCRESGPHVRGCWVIDLLLDKN